MKGQYQDYEIRVCRPQCARPLWDMGLSGLYLIWPASEQAKEQFKQASTLCPSTLTKGLEQREDK
jgi:hypothetical protein